MNKILLLSLCFFITSFQVFSSQTEINQGENKKIEVLAATFDVFQNPENISKIWPYFELNDVPTVVHFNNEHVYAFHLNSHSSDWQPIQKNHQQILFSDKDQWDLSKTMMHPAFPIEGKEAFAFGFSNNPDDIEISMITFVHERFHLHQFKHFNREAEQYANYQDQWNEENLTLMQIEEQLLTKFLTYRDNAKQRAEWLKDFVAVNTSRVGTLQASSVAWEDLQQRMEGLADYASFKTYSSFSLIPGFSAEDKMVKIRQSNLKAPFSLFQDAVKGRHYFMGSALGFALDFNNVKNWKERAEKGESLNKMLAQAFSLSDQDIKARVAKIQQSAAYHQIKEQVHQKVQNEVQEIDRVIAAYDSLDGIPVSVFNPYRSISGGGKNKKKIALLEGGLVAMGNTSHSSSEDQQWEISFDRMPYLIQEQGNLNSFKVENTLAVQYDDRTISIQEIYDNHLRLPFKAIFWKGEHSELRSDIPGEIYVKDGKVYIEFLGE